MSGGVKKLAQVAVGAVLGFAQGGPWGAVAGAALAFYAAEQQEKLNTKSPLRDNEPSAQTVRSSKAPVRFILGRVSTGGVLVWAQEQSGAQGEGEWLHLVYVLCEGAIDALENIYLGEEEIGSFGPLASYELIVNPTQVNAFLKANCPDWKDSQIGRGLSFVRVSLQYSAEKFPSGIPDTRFVVRGRNDIYDPRTGTSGYSANTALHLLWFLRTRCGVPDDEIVFETFASAANVCDEALTNADGSTSQRYRTACVIGADEQRTGVLQKLEAASGGRLIRVGGRWMFQAGAYYGPYDFEITEDMVIGTVTGSTEPTNDSAINTVRGTFIDPEQSWTETDYPEVSVSEWIVEDGGEAAETLTYSYVTDPYQAQRLANMELRRRRAGGAISIPMNFAGYNCRPGRVVRVNLPSLNILGEFIVSDWSMGDSEGCTVQVKQYEAPIFDDAVGQPYNPIGFINLPAGGLGSPTNLKWTQDASAEVTQGILSWLPPSGIVKEYIVIVRQGATAIQSHNVPATSTERAINGLPSGSYTMSVAAVGPMARSGEATISVSVNGPPIPEACVVQSSIDSITLIPSNTLRGLNGGTYEYFFSTVPSSDPDDAVYLGQGLTFTHTGLGFFTNYYYFVRSSNAYGKSAFLYVPASTSNDVGAYLNALDGQLNETQLGQGLLSRIELIDGPPTLPGSVSNRVNELGEQIGEVRDHLQELVNEGQAALDEAQQAFSEAQSELQQQIDQVSTLAKSGEYQKDKAYVVGASTRLNDRLYQAKIAVPADASGAKSPPNATYWVDVGQVVSDSNGLAARVNITETKITSIEGVNTSQGTAITGLNNSLTTTNTNVTAAQNAANAANTLAGGKGKVLVQTAAPAAADQLAQNLWIDITGGANTPKRWTGSAWAAVTDKVATDAAAAAANALAVANTKADASAVNSLTTRVTAAEGTISSQGTSITGLTNSLTTTNTNVTAAQNAASAANTLAGGKGKVLLQTAAPAAADQLAQNLWIDITGGVNTPKRWTGSAWTAVTDKVATDAAAAAANALSVANTKADAAAVTALNSRVTNTEGAITSQSDSLTQLNNTLTRVGDNSPTKVYQSLFTALAVDTWRLTNSTGSTSTFSNVAGNTSGATLTLDSGAGNKNWWGNSNKLIRFDPTRLYKLSLRVQQVSIPASTIPQIIAGVDCFAEDGVTKVNTAGANLWSSSHYLLTSGAQLAVGNWVEFTAYVKGFTVGSEAGGSGAGTLAVPKRLKAGTAYFSPMIISGYNNVGGVLAIDYFTVDDVTDQVQIDATSAALVALDSTVTQQGTTLTSQGNSLTSLNNSLTATNTNVTAAQTAANAANALAGGKGKVIVQAAAPAAADQLAQNLWIDITGGANTPKRWTGSAWAAVTDKVATDAAAAAANALSVANTKADASALNSLTTRVTAAEGSISSQGSSLTSLNNSLATTNTNVTAAQNAANAANTLAGGKGKVIVQTGAPAAADQLAQNLWIDITGGANTPKRWTGSAWAAVTDKVATDAAAAAASALSQVATKADASAVTSLGTRVTAAEGAITSQGNSITSLTNNLSTAGGENLIYNPSFDKAGTTTGVAEGWVLGQAAGVVSTPTLVASTIDPAGKAQRLDMTGLNASNYADLGPLVVNRPSASPGQVLTMSAHVRATAGLSVRLYFQFKDSAGNTITTDGPSSFTADGNVQRIVKTTSSPAPANTVAVHMLFRTVGTAALTAGFVEWGRVQLEISPVVTGWRDSSKALAADQAATSAALSSLSSTVTQQGTTLTSQGASLTSLNNSLSTTNINVTAAQNAANAANTLAGGKGKVLVQTAPPAAADQLAQNLWIDITGGANTPKRWTGSAWAAVTDKVATDAAAAAANALSVANTKADAAAVTGLTSRVTAAEGTISSQGDSITSLINTISRVGQNSPTRVYQSLFSALASDQWRLNSASLATISFSNVAGNLSGATLTFDCGTGKHWWGATNKLIRFDPSRLYKVRARVQQVSTVAGNTQTYLGLDGYAEDGVTRISTTGGNTSSSAHYVLAGAKVLEVGVWTEFSTYVKGFTIGAEGGGAGAGTLADPKRMKTGIAWISPMGIFGYNNVGGVAALDYFWIEDVTEQVQIEATSSALSSLTSTVTQQGTTMTSQGSSITSLTNSLTTTNTNVTAAQNAANAANTLAGGKGKVLVQTTAPAAADQLAQNLWIDITGGANTPKRWTGSTWAAVTDKVAADAAAAAASALSVANTKADASAVSSLTTRVTSTEEQITAQANKLDGIYVQVNPVLAGDAAGYAGSTASFVGVWSEQSARIEDGIAIGREVDTVQAAVDANNATVQQVSQAQAGLNGKVSAMWSVKLQVNAQGQYVAAGVGLGIENGPAGLQSTFLVSADRFAVVNDINGTLSSPFAVTGGQVFIRSAFIQDLSLSFGKIADNIQSDNYVANSTGWKLSKAGGMELNSTVAGQGRVQVTNRAVKVWDANGVLRVQLGDLSA
jgi:DNA polymerase IIIc chi subunit